MPAPRLLLVNPWITDFAAANLWARPLGLLRVAEQLSAGDADLRWIDCLEPYTPKRFGAGRYPKTVLPTPEPLRGVRRRYGRYGIPEAEFRTRLAAALPADAILVTSVMTYWYPGVQAVIRLCRELAPGVPILLGGLYARLAPEHARAHAGADQVFTGPADASLFAALGGLGVSLAAVRAPRPYYRLGLSPLPAYAPLLTSEGCPYACAYCASPRLAPTFSRRGPDEVAAEIRELAGLGAADFAFYDDALLAGAADHLEPILDRVIADGLGVRFHTPNGLHARFVTPGLAARMRRAGFVTLRLALETIDPARQAGTGGKVSTAEFDRAAAYFLEAGFPAGQLGAYLLYGLPGQGWDEVARGAEHLMRRGVRVHLTEYSPLPGTPLWDDLVRAGTIPADCDPLLTNNTVFASRYAGYDGAEVDALKRRVTAHNRALPAA